MPEEPISDKPVLLKAIELVLADPAEIMKETKATHERFKKRYSGERTEDEIATMVADKIISKYSYCAARLPSALRWRALCSFRKHVAVVRSFSRCFAPCPCPSPLIMSLTNPLWTRMYIDLGAQLAALVPRRGEEVPSRVRIRIRVALKPKKP